MTIGSLMTKTMPTTGPPHPGKRTYFITLRNSCDNGDFRTMVVDSVYQDRPGMKIGGGGGGKGGDYKDKYHF